ncbi:MAG: hypothetical protein IJW53_05125 [Clostridia bacterium]|nr:hypothetical protein [Clostridia bacterium]
MEKKNIFTRIWASVKEGARKFTVTLKRNPHYIPLAMLLVSFVILSFNLTKISNTTATMNKMGMGLCAFISMLLSILSMVCMLNAFPKRQKPKIAVIVLMLVLFAIIIAADAFYCVRVINGVTTDPDAIKVTEKNYFIVEAQNALIVHIVMMALTAVSVILEPVFAKLLKKINTSINVEDNGEITEIDISEED